MVQPDEVKPSTNAVCGATASSNSGPFSDRAIA
jgi:hypothetical protein